VTSQTGAQRETYANKKTGMVRPAGHALRYLWEKGPLFFKLGLLCGDGPDQDAEYCFGYDVRNRIADLLAGCRRHTGDPEHLDDVHEGVGQPGDDREPASVPREISNRPLLVPRGLFQSDGQLRHNVDERNHGKEPPGAVGC